jgi:flagellar hook-associated protein 2
LVAAEGSPTTLRLNKKEAVYQADLSAVGLLKAALSEFQTAVKGLSNKTVFQARTVDVPEDAPFEINVNTTAATGSYDVEVLSLAKAAKVRSAGFADKSETIGTGSLSISLGGSSFDITVDESNKSLEGIRDAINENTANPGITASIIHVDDGYQLVLTSDKVGEENTIEITATDDDAADGFDLGQLATANLTVIQPAQDAQMKVDGQIVTRNRNRFSDVITGVTFDLKKPSEPGESERFEIKLDEDSIKTKVSEFVTAYNDLNKIMTSLGAYDPETKEAGQMQGDSGLRAIKSQIRNVMSNAIEGEGVSFSSLASIGIKTNKEGILESDGAKLSEVIGSDFNAIANLFSSENGLAKKIDKTLSGFLESNGILGARTKSVETRLKGVESDRETLAKRLTVIEARYRKQFGAMDALVASFNSTGAYLAQQLDNLPGPRILK